MTLSASMPVDGRFSDTLRELAARVAAYVGYAAADAKAIGETVDRAVATIREHALDRRDSQNVDLRFATDGSHIEIRILFGPGQARPVAPADIERRFTGGQGGRAHLDRMRGVMHVEFGSEGDRDYCRLVRALPVNI